MGGVDVIVFTAGIGENTDTMRSAMCKDLEFLGVEFDEEKNAGLRGKEAIISKPSSKVTVCVIPTNEELAIAQETEELVKG
nr:acetate kinase [Saccharofermentans sp.]